MSYRSLLFLSAALLLALSLPGAVIAQVPAASSTNFVLETFTIDGGGGFTSSTNFRLNGSLGQTAINLGGNHTHLLGAGFWTAFGGAPQPIVLRASPGLAPGDVRLDWTGSFPNYQISRSIGPNNVLANPLIQTPLQAFEDTGADPFAVLFYLVEPGP